MIDSFNFAVLLALSITSSLAVAIDPPSCTTSVFSSRFAFYYTNTHTPNLFRKSQGICQRKGTLLSTALAARKKGGDGARAAFKYQEPLKDSTAFEVQVQQQAALPAGLRERTIVIGAHTYKVVEVEKTVDLVDDWIQSQMARVDPFGLVLWPAAQCIVANLLHTPPSSLSTGTGKEHAALLGSEVLSEIQEEESEEGSGKATEGGRMWIKGLTVMEVGAGTGLCSLAAAAAGASVVTTDTNELTLDLVHLAAVRQHLQLKTALFDITGADKLPKTDVFIAADCMYNKAVAKALARRCIEAHTRGAHVLVGDSVDIAREHFEEELIRGGQAFSTSHVPMQFTGSAVGADEEVERSVTVALYNFQNKIV